MKKLMMLLFLPSLLVAQPEEADGELFVWLSNRGSSWNVTIKLTAVSARWDGDYELTNDYEIVSDNVSSPSDFIAAFEHILDPGNEQEYAIGLYKISAIENDIEQAYFYMDWRTSNWNSSLDVNFTYDVGNNDFKEYNTSNIIDYSYQTLWDLTDNSLVTSGLEDYWDNCLAVTNNGSNKPRFILGPYPDYLQGTITGYKIYRSASHVPGQPPSNFTILSTLDDDEYVYTDNTVTMGTDYNAKSYYTKCVYEYPEENVIETAATNTVEVRLEIPQKITTDNNSFSAQVFYLEQNYPNPFNPFTKISFTIPISDLVNLKVYDVLGNEVQTLINEVKDAGSYSLEFNADNLPSGIYMYKLMAGDFTQTRKMILIK